MLGKLSASPFLTIENSELWLFPLRDVLTSRPNLKLPARTDGVNQPALQNNRRKRPFNFGCKPNRWKICSVDQPQLAMLDGNQIGTWEESKEILYGLNFSTEEADVILKKAFGWVHSPYWGEERIQEIPKIGKVVQTLEYIRSLGLSDNDLYKLLKKFPEVLGCSLDDEVKLNVSKLESEWGIKGKALRNLLLRNPKVLGYNVDCKGDCMAKCTRCWVRF